MLSWARSTSISCSSHLLATGRAVLAPRAPQTPRINHNDNADGITPLVAADVPVRITFPRMVSKPRIKDGYIYCVAAQEGLAAEERADGGGDGVPTWGSNPAKRRADMRKAGKQQYHEHAPRAANLADLGGGASGGATWGSQASTGVYSTKSGKRKAEQAGAGFPPSLAVCLPPPQRVSLCGAHFF